MKVAGSHVISAPRQEVWDALHDPAVLARTLPGCQQLEVTAPDCYAATVHAGVAAVKGLYSGEVELTEKQPPERYTMRASGAGGPGTIRAEAVVTLHDEGGATRVEYDADAVVGGMIGGVGQRMLVGVARRTADDFFAAVERDLLGQAVPATGVGEAVTEGVPALQGAQGAQGAIGKVFPGRPTAPPPGAPELWRYLAAVFVGAAIALLGVAVGRRSVR